MSRKNSNYLKAIRNIRLTSIKCESLISDLQSALRQIHYLSVILTIKAKNKGYDENIINILQEDARFASTLRFEELKELSDKILEFIFDFTSYLNTNKQLQKLLEEDEKIEVD